MQPEKGHRQLVGAGVTERQLGFRPRVDGDQPRQARELEEYLGQRAGLQEVGGRIDQADHWPADGAGAVGTTLDSSLHLLLARGGARLGALRFLRQCDRHLCSGHDSQRAAGLASSRHLGRSVGCRIGGRTIVLGWSEQALAPLGRSRYGLGKSFGHRDVGHGTRHQPHLGADVERGVGAQRSHWSCLHGQRRLRPCGERSRFVGRALGRRGCRRNVRDFGQLTDLALEFAGCAVHQLRRDVVLVAEKGAEQQAIAQAIDLARYAPGPGVDALERIGCELRSGGPTDQAQPVFNVGLRFGRCERAQMARRNDTLAQLLHRLRLQ